MLSDARLAMRIMELVCLCEDEYFFRFTLLVQTAEGGLSLARQPAPYSAADVAEWLDRRLK
jgi:hypothetical protein